MHATLKMAGLHYLKFKGKMMKKVMFMIVGMLFSVSVSAATMTISDVSGGQTATNTNEYGHGTDALNISAASYSDGDEISDSWVLTTIGGSNWRFTIKPNYNNGPQPDPFSAMLGNISYTTNALGNIVFTTFLAAGNHTFQVLGLANFTRTSYDVTINAVPVPAALFLFAPALLGFFGLRRKSAVAV